MPVPAAVNVPRRVVMHTLPFVCNEKNQACFLLKEYLKLCEDLAEKAGYDAVTLLINQGSKLHKKLHEEHLLENADAARAVLRPWILRVDCMQGAR
jgi:hypothetical protein